MEEKWGTKMQLWKLKAKKWIFDLAKHGLIKTWDKSKFGLIFGRPKRGEEKGKREREKKKKKKRKRRRRERDQAKRYGTLIFVWNLV